MGLYEENKILERLDNIEVALNTLLQLARSGGGAQAQQQADAQLSTATTTGAADPTAAESNQDPAKTGSETPLGTGDETAPNTQTVGSAQVGNP
jgi:hypothetical protein